MKERNTKQKELILEVMKHNKNHPTIAEIYNLVKEIDPTIGQATVYRNVKRYVESGKLYVVKTIGGIDHYDYNTEHVHFECMKCGKIIDIMDNELFKELKSKFQNRKEEISSYQVSIQGYCEECMRGNDGSKK